MTIESNTRRQFLRVAVGGAGAAALLAATAESASAYQGNMERALADLQSALQALHEATPDKGGHKARAAGLVEQAMGEVQAGIDFAAQHYGD